MTKDLDALPLPVPTHFRNGVLYAFSADQIRAARREGYELAKREAQEGREPVAWRVRRSDGEHELFFHEPTAKQRAECFVPHSSAEPLFTAPPPKSDEAMRKVLKNVRACLREANECDNGPINDTIWFTPTETLFDYIDAALEAPKISDAMDAQRYRLLRDFDSGMTELAICRWSEHGWVGEWVIEHDPDAAIDAALAAQQKGGE